MLEFFLRHYNYFATALLILIGIYGMFAKGNLVKKLMGMNIFQVGVILFFISVGVKTGATVPIAEGHVAAQPDHYLNPLPHGLMLTAIVVGVATTGVALALLIRIYRKYGTLEERELLKKLDDG
jgi:multicomponent Na+:H+ antiporter subunit C